MQGLQPGEGRDANAVAEIRKTHLFRRRAGGGHAAVADLNQRLAGMALTVFAARDNWLAERNLVKSAALIHHRAAGLPAALARPHGPACVQTPLATSVRRPAHLRDGDAGDDRAQSCRATLDLTATSQVQSADPCPRNFGT